MAEARSSVDQDQDQLFCPVCLDPVMDTAGPCGHNFCMICIKGCCNQEDQDRVYICPHCREAFTARSVLRRNTMLTEVVEIFSTTELQAASADQSSTGSGDVECDICIGPKCRAVKSCLSCRTSFCETHLKPHYEIPGLKEHTLIEALTKLEDKICSDHDELMGLFCRTDQSFICSLCVLDKHKGHDVVSLGVERSEKETELHKELRKFQQRIQEKQKEVQELNQAVINIKHSAQAAVEDSEGTFSEMISSLEKKRSEVTELIRDEEETELSQAEELLQELEQEIDLKRRTTELEKLSHTQDHIHFLQSFQSLCVSSGCEDSPSISLNQHLSFDGVRKSLSDMKEQLEDLWKQDFKEISKHVAAVQVILPSEPKNREDFLKYFCFLTLDPNTANPNLILSERNRVVTQSKTRQPYPDHPERFDIWEQVLCKESVCGRCYWEVERRGNDVGISVSYIVIKRKGVGHESGFGWNHQSWFLWFSSSSLSFYHNKIQTDLRVPSSSRIGVYVDHSAGTLSFYSISDTMRLLHRVQTTFTQPLYAGFWLDEESAVRLCDPI